QSIIFSKLKTGPQILFTDRGPSTDWSSAPTAESRAAHAVDHCCGIIRRVSVPGDMLVGANQNEHRAIELIAGRGRPHDLEGQAARGGRTCEPVSACRPRTEIDQRESRPELVEQGTPLGEPVVRRTRAGAVAP